MPDERTTVTELATALGMLGPADLAECLEIRPPALQIDPATWERLGQLCSETRLAVDAGEAFANGRAFLAAADGLRHRLPLLVEWTGGRRPPGDEVAPIDLRVDHVYQVSCKYMSRNIANVSPARLFVGLLATTGGWARGDWYEQTAAEELTACYRQCRAALGRGDLPDDPHDLSPSDRRSLSLALRPRMLPAGAAEAYLALCRRVSRHSVERWRESLEHDGDEGRLVRRLLRIGASPYFLLGVDRRGPLRLRVDCAWTWRQRFKVRRFSCRADDAAAQPKVQWSARVVDRATGSEIDVRGHVEIRWSHGRFSGPPEAKLYLDVPVPSLPGYNAIDGDGDGDGNGNGNGHGNGNGNGAPATSEPGQHQLFAC